MALMVMMQVVLVAIGSHGDVLPFLALGAELRRRGHPVILAAPAPFEAAATSAGLAFHALGDQAIYEAVIDAPDLWHPRRGARILFNLAATFLHPVYALLADHAAKGPVIAVASILCLGARVAQEKLGIPVVTVHLSPFLLRSRHAPPQFPGLPVPQWLPAILRHRLQLGADHYVIDPLCLPWLNAYRAELDLPPVTGLRSWWNSPLRVVLMFPGWFAPAPEDWPPQALQVGFPSADEFGDARALSQELQVFLEAGEAPLVFTYGSAMRQSQWFFQTATRICARMARRGVLLAPQPDQVPGDLPASVIHVPYAPLSQLLPRCSALIHHGGIGTVAQGMAAGVPQLIVPVSFDHFDEGARIERLGVGHSLPRRRFTARRASRRLEKLLTSVRVAEACDARRHQMASDADATRSAANDVDRLIGLA